ncbi:sugar transferase [Flavobacterium sp. CFBP9031]|uniref:Sugar transferase n=1 Tax=Flavobacterium chungangensis TaxID=2708132 RepID=A0ABV8ZDS0_9FLAO|nr:sugar transferase [Flavobacterium sp. CFBP9031]MDY0986382.1 sugar transferase [Flavobacterium sp. CFBP9031]
MNNFSPVVLFAYKRLGTLQKTVQSLQKNYLAEKSDLYIFSDEAKTSLDKTAVTAVRKYLHSINGFKSITIYEASINKGLANSIRDGVSQVLKTHETVIVLEDDLVSSANFLNFMNEALLFYKDESKVFSIAGFSMPIKVNTEFDNYFTQRSSSTGWATWRNRWLKIDWNVSDYNEFKENRKARNNFNKMGSDMSNMLDRQMQGKINSWAIRWCYHQFKYDLFSAHAFVSKIENVGFTKDASNTTETYNRFQTILDSGLKTNFLFSSDIRLDPKIIKQFTKPFSILSRIKYKVINLFQ